MTDPYIRDRVKNIETYPMMNERIKEIFSVQGSTYIELYVVKRLIELEDEINSFKNYEKSKRR